MRTKPKKATISTAKNEKARAPRPVVKRAPPARSPAKAPRPSRPGAKKEPAARGDVPPARGSQPGLKKEPLVRGDAIVTRVLDATLQELSQSGYRALRVEDVAARARVNKTTVYRRWPTKADLVRDTLVRKANFAFVLPQTGSIRGDLLGAAKVFVKYATDPIGRSLVRMFAAESSDPEVIAIARSLRERDETGPRRIIEAAIARGELAPGLDHSLILHAMVGALHHRLFFVQGPLDDGFLEGLVDLLLRGALASSARPHNA
ncbi:MAG: TetR/AcrR family transcriptional regulator [Polyangiaceae bacterium]